jgi:hypothetical protein
MYNEGQVQWLMHIIPTQEAETRRIMVARIVQAKSQ